MANPSHHPWYQSVRRIFSLFSAKEVKTPLSFFFRLTSVIVVLVSIGGALIQPSQRLWLFIGAGIILFLLALIVGAIAWSRPKHLVYGETGYRAETRLSLGTEKEQMGEAELSSLPGISNPNVPGIVKNEAQ
jgi:hypothetical protein